MNCIKEQKLESNSGETHGDIYTHRAPCDDNIITLILAVFGPYSSYADL